ncbi:Crp/Fnr family transcriptional regulator [Alsobacter sp. SYSU M60028]|uniref:Crp/Fnr family transcriptional regulator n=1 Tax=Alsobacter ponti TaxID=2962936 RepID=A0ABT1LDK6_9HYPH|nr:Crp/Fnr family transcriptional regulator [Alsobacter ponti]MCP8939544.1 Crp/Fnr family transcriptional regulator [Alsobacter ponti]
MSAAVGRLEPAGTLVRSSATGVAASAVDPWRDAPRRRFGHNAIIYAQDDVATHVHMVVSGLVRLSHLMEDGTLVVASFVPPGATFGELGVLDQQETCEMASAVGETLVASLPVARLRTLAAAAPALERELTRAVARRYRSYVESTRYLSLKSLPARLSQALLRLADELGTHTVVGNRRCKAIPPQITQTELGLMARGARGNINRILGTWQRRGWIACAERTIAILDPESLAGIALESE